MGAAPRRAGVRERAGADRPDRAGRRAGRGRRTAPLTWNTVLLRSPGGAASARVGRGPSAGDQAHTAEVVVPSRPASDAEPTGLQRDQSLLVHPRLRVDDVAFTVDAGPVDGRLRPDPLVQDGGGDSDERGAQTRATRR